MKNLDVNNFAPHSFADGLVVSHLPFGPTAYFTLSNTVMRHDIPKIGTMSEAYPHLIFHNFNSKLGERVSLEIFRVQLFEGQQAQTQDQIFIQVSLFLCSKALLGLFSLFCVEHPIIKLLIKRSILNFL